MFSDRAHTSLDMINSGLSSLGGVLHDLSDAVPGSSRKVATSSSSSSREKPLSTSTENAERLFRILDGVTALGMDGLGTSSKDFTSAAGEVTGRARQVEAAIAAVDHVKSLAESLQAGLHAGEEEDGRPAFVVPTNTTFYDEALKKFYDAEEELRKGAAGVKERLQRAAAYEGGGTIKTTTSQRQQERQSLSPRRGRGRAGGVTITTPTTTKPSGRKNVEKPRGSSTLPKLQNMMPDNMMTKKQAGERAASARRRLMKEAQSPSKKTVEQASQNPYIRSLLRKSVDEQIEAIEKEEEERCRGRRREVLFERRRDMTKGRKGDTDAIAEALETLNKTKEVLQSSRQEAREQRVFSSARMSVESKDDVLGKKERLRVLQGQLRKIAED